MIFITKDDIIENLIGDGEVLVKIGNKDIDEILNIKESDLLNIYRHILNQISFEELINLSDKEMLKAIMLDKIEEQEKQND